MPFIEHDPAVVLAWLAGLAALFFAGLWWRERAARLALLARLRADPAALPRLEANAAPPAGAGPLDRRALEQAIDERHGAEGPAPCLLWVALDDPGQLERDQLPALTETARATLLERLRAALPHGALLARLGAAEHGILLAPGTDAQAIGLAEPLRAAIAEPLDLAGRVVRLRCSIGIASGRLDAKMLCARAAVALRAVQHAGGDGVAVFDPHMALDERERADLMTDLRNAVQRRQLEIYYQPSLDARTRQVVAAEALLRWRHPQRGLVPPTEFIRLAEECGVIEAFGNWLIDSVMDQAAEWQKRKLSIRVAVNLSAFQLRQDTLAARIEQGLRAHRLRPDALCCEIDAPLIADDAQGAQRLLARLAGIGVQLSIDNFGRADANLALLRRVPAEEVKLRRALVAELGEDSAADARCRSIIEMAHSRGLRVVGTGVETDEQRDRLIALGCDALQGHLYAQAMSPKALTAWASERPFADSGQPPQTRFQQTLPHEEDTRRFVETMPFEPTRPMEGEPPPAQTPRRAA